MAAAGGGPAWRERGSHISAFSLTLKAEEGDGLTPTSSEDPDFGERKSPMKAETSMGKPFPVPHEYHRNKSPKGPGQAQ
ncbi:hypothetical protein AV530_004599 [Patagioenas fasciata monilis]|uniref:Uncharacterized protein n=1 Tax=Patagioenas fasciata monilis TaxID=372326 RepID=A0A1V4KHK5_PATFA|nr:hypothetical protein AV530_004599 [Patagioenas fasciata monilis]